MQDLIQLSNQIINGNTIETVSARELHTFLESKRQFADWVKDRIDKYSFIENQDFICVSQKNETQRADGQRGVTVTTEYFVTLDMAKQLCMVENNEKGMQARKYFIECEKQLKENQLKSISTEEGKFKVLQQLTSLLNISPTAKETLLITGAEQLLGINIDYRPAISRKLLSAKEVGNKLGISAHMAGKIANHLNLKTADNGMVVLDKSRYSNKQVDSFKYYAHVVDIMDKHIKEFDIKTDKVKYHE